MVSMEFWGLDLLRIRVRPKSERIRPWAMSPNIMPNRNGKVIVVKKAGLA